MPSIDWIDNGLRKYALERHRMFASLSLQQLKAPSENFCSVSNSFLRFLYRYQDSVISWVDECASAKNRQAQAETLQFFTKNTIAFVQSQNQFILIGEPEKTALTAEYARFLGDFGNAVSQKKQTELLPNRLRQVLAVHQIHLEQFVKGLEASNLNRDFVFSTPVCSYYSPELQLRILHASASNLLEPILDLGCGETGELVHFLRDRAKQALGVDRTGAGNRFAVNADWFDFPMVPGFWGTIVSHLAFSNHFLHHYLRRGGHPEEYARRYMEVLSALKPGGSFLYAPGLPFIEQLLPRGEYLVEQWTIAGISGTGIDRYFRTVCGFDVLYACKVTRKPKSI